MKRGRSWMILPFRINPFSPISSLQPRLAQGITESVGAGVLPFDFF